MDLIHQLHFLRPSWLLALPLCWGLGLSGWRGGAVATADWARLIDPELLPGLRLAAGGGKGSLAPWPWLALAWTLAVLALAGPTWQRDATAAWRAPAAWVLVARPVALDGGDRPGAEPGHPRPLRHRRSARAPPTMPASAWWRSATRPSPSRR